MTPTEIETFARRQYNAVGDTFFGEDEIMNYIYKAQMEFCKYTNMLRKTYSTDSVVDQKEYPMPDETISIKRIEFDGLKLSPIDFREDDDLGVLNTVTTTSDQPGFYYQWGSSFFLTPTPNAVKEIKIYIYKRPSPVTNTSVIEIPGEYHLNIVDFVLWMMASKDENPVAAKQYQSVWVDAMREARKLERRKLRGDSFASVKDIERLAVTRYGTL